MEELLTAALQNGFAIAVAAYLLVRIDKRLDEFTKAVAHLEAVIERKGIK